VLRQERDYYRAKFTAALEDNRMLREALRLACERLHYHTGYAPDALTPEYFEGEVLRMEEFLQARVALKGEGDNLDAGTVEERIVAVLEAAGLPKVGAKLRYCGREARINQYEMNQWGTFCRIGVFSSALDKYGARAEAECRLTLAEAAKLEVLPDE
jgi:hypothetical protein